MFLSTTPGAGFKSTLKANNKLNFASFLFMISCTVALTSSCALAHKDLTGAVPKVPEAKLMVTTNVVDVDIDFKTRVTGQSAKAKTIMQAKDAAYYQAIVKNNIDVLVDPVYQVISRGKRSKAMVTGFAGHYKNVRTETQEIQAALESTAKNSQAAFEAGLKDKQMTFDQSMEELDKKIRGIEKLAAVSAISKEDLKTYIIIAGGNGSSEKTIGSNTGIIEKYNALLSGAPAEGAAPAASGDAKPEAKPEGDKGGDDKGGAKEGPLMKKIKGMMKKN